MKDINENKFILPQVIAKSALFTISTATKKNRKKVNNKLVFNHGGTEIYLSGYELTMRDEDVLLALLQQSEKHTSLSYEMSLNELTKIAFGYTSSLARKAFIESIEMLYDADIKIINKDENIIMNSRIIYSKAYKSGELFRVRINEDMKNLLTLSAWQVKPLRYKLNNLAKKVYSYISTNSGYAFISFNSLYQLSGSTKKRMDHFKNDCIKSFGELESAGVLSSYKVVGNTIHYTVKSFNKISYKQATIRNIEMELNTQELLGSIANGVKFNSGMSKAGV